MIFLESIYLNNNSLCHTFTSTFDFDVFLRNVDLARHSPAFSDIIPIHDTEIGFWSFITSIFELRYAWVLYAHDGSIGAGFKTQADFRVIAVSGIR